MLPGIRIGEVLTGVVDKSATLVVLLAERRLDSLDDPMLSVDPERRESASSELPFKTGRRLGRGGG